MRLKSLPKPALIAIITAGLLLASGTAYAAYNVVKKDSPKPTPTTQQSVGESDKRLETLTLVTEEKV